MGLGRFGGGVGVTRWLATQGAEVLVTDRETPARLEAARAELAPLVEAGRVTMRLGGHDTADFLGRDLVVANPAVAKPWDDPHLRAAARDGARVTTEICLLIERLDRRRVIGVTGSAGKSTTAAMIHHVLYRAGVAAHLGGNIGGSLLGELGCIMPGDLVVLELSSAMLHWIGETFGGTWSPAVAVLTNVSPNHLDWHGTFEHYHASKRRIFEAQRDGDVAIDGTRPDAFGDTPRVTLPIPGEHNRRNAALALAAAGHAAGLEPREAATLLDDFAGLPHRLQLVADRGGIRCYDDSKSTTPEATRLAVDAFDEPGRVHLIAGGHDKGVELSGLWTLAGSLGGLYTIGATGPIIAARAARGSETFACGTLDAAVDRAWPRLRAGDVLLLSPGCASWDQFANYEERGRAFRRLVTERASGN